MEIRLGVESQLLFIQQGVFFFVVFFFYSASLLLIQQESSNKEREFCSRRILASAEILSPFWERSNRPILPAPFSCNWELFSRCTVLCKSCVCALSECFHFVFVLPLTQHGNEVFVSVSLSQVFCEHLD